MTCLRDRTGTQLTELSIPLGSLLRSGLHLLPGRCVRQAMLAGKIPA
jgi:hypothetical protein